MKNLFKRLFGGAEAKPAPSASITPAQTPVARPFQPVNELEHLLALAATDPAQRAAFQAALLEADLYAATPEAPAVESQRLSTGETVKLLNVEAPDGGAVAALFTSQQRIVECFGEGAGYLQIPGAVLLEMVAGTGAVLNPNSAYGVHWTPEQLAAVLGKPFARTVAKETKILLGVPSEPPTALLAKLGQLLRSESRIEEAWFALAHWPEEKESGWYLDIRTRMPREAVGSLLQEAFRPEFLGDKPLDMLVRAPGEAGEGAGIRLVPPQTH